MNDVRQTEEKSSTERIELELDAEIVDFLDQDGIDAGTIVNGLLELERAKRQYRSDGGVVESLTTPQSEGRQCMVTLKDLIDELEGETNSGAVIDDVIQHATERFDKSESAVRGELDTLKMRGEVYEPQDGRVRVT